MAATIASVKSLAVPGDVSYSTIDYTFDNSYPTGGLALAPADFGLSRILFVQGHIRTASAAAAANFSYDNVTNKLKLFTTTAEVANGIDCSAIVVRVTAFGYR